MFIVLSFNFQMMIGKTGKDREYWENSLSLTVPHNHYTFSGIQK